MKIRGSGVIVLIFVMVSLAAVVLIWKGTGYSFYSERIVDDAVSPEPIVVTPPPIIGGLLFMLPIIAIISVIVILIVSLRRKVL